jgi:hypothetical protein
MFLNLNLIRRSVTGLFENKLIAKILHHIGHQMAAREHILSGPHTKNKNTYYDNIICVIIVNYYFC